jgi:hypothetical protein
VTRSTDDAVPRSRAALAAAGAVCAALDATVTSHGFLAGQPGASASGGAAVFCAPWATFRRRLPGLASLVEGTNGIGDGGVDPTTACIDLEVSVVVDPGADPALGTGTGRAATARLTAVRLEGRDLGTVVREVGRADLAAELAAVLAVPLPAALPRLDAAVSAILSGGGGGGMNRPGR